jgi:archaellum component FlaC
VNQTKLWENTEKLWEEVKGLRENQERLWQEVRELTGEPDKALGGG